MKMSKKCILSLVFCLILSANVLASNDVPNAENEPVVDDSVFSVDLEPKKDEDAQEMLIDNDKDILNVVGCTDIKEINSTNDNENRANESNVEYVDNLMCNKKACLSSPKFVKVNNLKNNDKINKRVLVKSISKIKLKQKRYNKKKIKNHDKLVNEMINDLFQDMLRRYTNITLHSL